MKKNHILCLLIAFLSLNIGAQTIKHNKQVKLKVVNELVAPSTDSKVLVLDPVNDRIRYVEAQNLPGVASGGGVLESVDEGNGAGYRNSDIIPENRGNIGQRAYDFGFGSVASTTFGPTGTVSVDFGEDNILSGYGSVGFGDNNSGTSTYAFITGSNNNDNGNGGWNLTGGFFNTHTGGANTFGSTILGMRNINRAAHSLTGGNGSDNSAVGGLTWGLALNASGTHGTSFLGTANADVAASGFNSTDGPLLIVGNGTVSSAAGGSGQWTPILKSNAFELYRDGKLILPSTDVSDIVDPKHVVTKEYFDENAIQYNAQFSEANSFPGQFFSKSFRKDILPYFYTDAATQPVTNTGAICIEFNTRDLGGCTIELEEFLRDSNTANGVYSNEYKFTLQDAAPTNLAGSRGSAVGDNPQNIRVYYESTGSFTGITRIYIGELSDFYSNTISGFMSLKSIISFGNDVNLDDANINMYFESTAFQGTQVTLL